MEWKLGNTNNNNTHILSAGWMVANGPEWKSNYKETMSFHHNNNNYIIKVFIVRFLRASDAPSRW